MSHTILVTGGCGFIGSNFIRYIIQKYPDYNIINFDKLTYAGNLENLKDMEGNPHYHFIQGDIALDEDVLPVMKQCDWVVHFAAESHVDRSINGPEIFIRTNVLGTQILVEHAKINHIDRFVHISTDEVYGSLGPAGYFTENTPLSPNSPYSASKAGSDLIVQSYHHTYGFPALITRCSNNYGPYQYPEKFIPVMISQALANKPLPVYGDGLNIRDWLYVEDHCKAIDAVLHQGKIGEIYNIGGNNEIKNIDLAKLILKKLDKPESLITFVQDRLGHDRRYAIDSQKIKKELGWTPTISFEEGLQKTLQWYCRPPARGITTI